MLGITSGRGGSTYGLVCVLAVVVLVTPLAQKAAKAAPKVDFPKKNITWIVPYAPGGGYDVYSRAIARMMPKYLPKKVDIIVRNLPGAGGMRAYHTLMRSKADGHTIGIVNIQGMAVLMIMGKSKLDPTQFTYLGTIIQDIGTFMVAANSPFNKLEDLQKAEKVLFGSTGPPSLSWVAPTLARRILKIRAEIVTGYGGSSDFSAGMIRGDVHACFMGATSALPYVQAGEAKVPVAFKKTPLLPDAPYIEEGSPYREISIVEEDRVVAAPPGVPNEITRMLEDALLKTMQDEEIQKWSKTTGRILTPLSGKETAELGAELLKTYKKHAEAFR